jgi:hypothetical protein
MAAIVAHFLRSLRCGDCVRLRSYFCRAGEAADMPHHDEAVVGLGLKTTGT